MTHRHRSTVLLVLAFGLSLACPLSARDAADIDPDLARLQAGFAALEAEREFEGKAGLERLKASQAIAALAQANERQRPERLAIAEHRLAAARVAAQAELLAEQAQALDRERDQILVDASRREAETARREAERLRSRALAQQEEAGRLAELAEVERVARAETFALAEQARAEAEQARRLAAQRTREAQLAREEAELATALVAEAMAADAPLPPSRRVGDATVYTLAGNAFGSGRANLTTEAQASLHRLASGLSGRRVQVLGYTDSQGEQAANLRLSQRRAEAVAALLRQATVSEVTVEGRGEADPVADNASAEGRARNRRVEIFVR